MDRNSFIFRKVSLILSIIVVFSLSFNIVYAQQGLDFEIIAKLNTSSETPTIYLLTKDGALNDLDTFDQALPDQDKPELILRSVIDSSSTRYIADYWDAKVNSTRILEVRFQVGGTTSNLGWLNLSWDSNSLQDSDGRYSLILNDFYNDSNLINLNSSTNMNTNSYYLVFNDISTRYFTIETDYKYCGDSVCSSWESFSNCPGDCPDSGSPGPGGSSGGSSPPATCEDQCNLGERQCVSSDGFKVCGDFNNDGCYEWDSGQDCSSQTPYCSSGFCYGCLQDSHCSSGFLCINNLCVGETEEQEDYVPEDTRIEDNWKVDSEGGISCDSNFVCSSWSDCDVSYSSTDLISGRSWFYGERSRTCSDLNSCYVTRTEKESCSIKVEVYSKVVSYCGKDYVEIYEKGTDKLLASTLDLRYSPERSIEILLLPENIICDELEESFVVTWFDKLMFISDIRNFWRLFK